MLELKNIKKSFGGHEVLADVNLTVNTGEVYGLVGSNGAGKTTLMNIVARMLAPDAGQVLLDGTCVTKPSDVVGKVGYMLDIPALFDYMSAGEFFEYLASPLKLTKRELDARCESLLELVGLTGVGGKPMKSYSRGMRQRMGIAAGLVADPGLILMDEPTSALDPQGRFDVGNIIRRLAESGKTVVLSTHILSDVEKVCKRIGILSGGRIKVEGKIAEVLNRYNKPIYDLFPRNEEKLSELYEFVSRLPYAERVKCKETFVRVQIPDTESAVMKLFSDAAGSGIALRKLENLQTSLEEIFIQEANRT